VKFDVMTIEQVINHLRNRDYMSGVDRDRSRVKSTGEVFTPTPLVQEILNQLPQDQFLDPTKTFLDPSCGDGQFLSEVIIQKMENGSTYEQALSTVYGIDLMEDNCIECIRRLYGVNSEPVIVPITGDAIPPEWQSTYTVTTTELVDGKRIKKTTVHNSLTAVFEVNGKICNIVCGDGLKYDYRFGTLPPPPPAPPKPKKPKPKKKKAKRKPEPKAKVEKPKKPAKSKPKYTDEVLELFPYLK